MGISHLISFIDNVTKYLNGSQDPSIAVSEAIKLSPDDDVAAARLKPSDVPPNFITFFAIVRFYYKDK